MANASPSPDLLALAAKLAGFIAGGGKHLPDDLFAREVVIVENFAPFVFRDVAYWALEMRAHLAGNTDLAYSFGKPVDFAQDGHDAYFSLPTTWSGLNGGVPFRETGGWALAFTRGPKGWRLKGYGWAVVETTSKHAVIPG